MEAFAAGLGLWEGFTGIMGAFQQRKVEKQKVALEYESNIEDIRRRRFEQRTVEGAAKALSETAGVRHTPGSTAQGYLDTLSSEFKKEIDFSTYFAKRARRLGMTGANLNFQTNFMGALGSSGRSIAGSGVFG